MAMTKVGKLKLETSAYYQQKQDTKIAFYNTDENTSILRFIVTRNNDVLPLGKVNTDVMIHLTAEDGSWVIDDVGVTDELNGICEYQIPNEFLNHTGKVNGQVYISVDRKEDTVTEVEFSFTIKDASINKTPAVDKIFYIRKYSELEYRLKEKVKNIEDAYKNIDDYVTKVEQTTEDGVRNINETKDNVLSKINTIHDDNINQINTLGTQYVEDLTGVRDSVEDKIDQFNTDVESFNYVEEEETENWQKYKLTEEDGNRISKEGLDLLNLDTGYYETWNAVNDPLDGNTGIFEVNVTTGSRGQKTIVATQSHLNKTFINTIHTDGKDRGWKELVSLPLDEEIETQKSAESRANETLADAKKYVETSLNERHKTIFLGDARERNSTFSINESYKNFSYLLVRYRFSGGGKMVPAYIDTDKKIPIQDFNLTDSAGDNPKMNEMGLIFNTEKEFKVTHNNSFDIKKANAIYDDNDITLVEIVGVY